MARWYQDRYKLREILENISIPLFCITMAASGGAFLGGMIGYSVSGAIGPGHAAYERMKAREFNIRYDEPAGKPGYIKKGAIIGAETGAGICALVLSILAANEIRDRIKSR